MGFKPLVHYKVDFFHMPVVLRHYGQNEIIIIKLLYCLLLHSVPDTSSMRSNTKRT